MYGELAGHEGHRMGILLFVPPDIAPSRGLEPGVGCRVRHVFVRLGVRVRLGAPPRLRPWYWLGACAR